MSFERGGVAPFAARPPRGSPHHVVVISLALATLALTKHKLSKYLWAAKGCLVTLRRPTRVAEGGHGPRVAFHGVREPGHWALTSLQCCPLPSPGLVPSPLPWPRSAGHLLLSVDCSERWEDTLKYSQENESTTRSGRTLSILKSDSEKREKYFNTHLSMLPFRELIDFYFVSICGGDRMAVNPL